MESIEIRQTFLDFFKKKKHRIFASDNLIPSGDPTLLFTSAGMVRFKGCFLGAEELSFRRAASCQKCLRTSDIDQVGKTSRHLTFFEMLGNFSFGDYFKEEAILWAWEFLTRHLKIPEASLWVSIFREDDEAARIWERKAGFPKERIVRLGKEDNFWSMGETGPCGPCSEILFDRGEDKGCRRESCRVGCDCGRFLEIWNLVFTQYDRQKDGSLLSLPQKNIDTGMGLERLAALLQGKDSNFETDLIEPIIDELHEFTDFRYGKDKIKDISFRIIADHIRAVTFLISEGIYFSNVGRGYIARRLLRRASRHGRLLGIDESFLYRLSGVVGEIFKSIYPEVRQFREELSGIILEEEKRFNETLNIGLNELGEIIREVKSKGKKFIDGESVFKLYDSFGFPMEMTEEIASSSGLKIDKEKFELSMEKHKNLARRSWKKGALDLPATITVSKKIPQTEFTGYKKTKDSSLIKGIIEGGTSVPEADAGKTGRDIGVILDKTPFYAEAGGQVNDTGDIRGLSFLVEVKKVIKNAQGQIIHFGRLLSGEIKEGDKVTAQVDTKRRRQITHSHTATHLLQAALRTLIDKNIHQAGSWVEPDQFRFDFNYFKKLTPDEIKSVEDWVNQRIKEKIPLKIIWQRRDEAIKSGATALFGEKYKDEVRVVTIPGYSSELCGGLHVKNTAEIKIFKIIKEASVASGIRRIEAIMGKNGLDRLREESRLLKEAARNLGTAIEEVPKEVKRLLEAIKDLEKEKKSKSDSLPDLDTLLKEAEEVGGIKLLRKRFEGLSRKNLLSLIDNLRKKMDSGIVVLLSRHPEKIELVTSVSIDLVKKGYKADELAKGISRILGGSGGGRPDLGQGGGQDFSRIEKALGYLDKVLISS